MTMENELDNLGIRVGRLEKLVQGLEALADEAELLLKYLTENNLEGTFEQMKKVRAILRAMGRDV
jgi:hypothetical protein